MMGRRLTLVSVVAVVVAVFLPGSGFGSSAVTVRGARGIPAPLAAAIHARFGAAPVMSASSGATEHPQLGWDVALSSDGTTALVSAIGAGNQKGATYIYHVASAGSWESTSTPVATLSGTADHGLGEALGYDIALSADGTTAFVSAPLSNGGGGGVFVFHASDESAWASTSTPTATLTVPNGLFFGFDGLAVSSDGTTLVAGDESYNETGGAYVFHVSSESAWASTASPTATLSNAAQPSSDEGFGYGVAISGDGTTVLVGDNDSHGHAGGVDLFHVPAEAAWITSSTPTAILSNSSGVAHDYLGTALALSGDGTTAFLAAPGVNGYRGAVDVFHVANENLWMSSSTPAAILTDGKAAKYEDFGGDIAVSSDGTTAVAGALGTKQSAGAAFVFRASGEDAWASSSAPTAVLTDSAGARNDALGATVATAGDGATVLAGVPFVNWQTGKADVFHVADSSSWLTSSTPTAKLTNSALPKPRCVVPHLKKYPLDLAKYFLFNSNCRLGKVTKVHAAKKYKRKIVSQSPAPGRNLPPGSKVKVKIGK
jgi:hypothetical protein